MQQRPENFRAAGEDPEATLVTPRFDADDARHAHPVVPLTEAPARASDPNGQRTRPVRSSRRTWASALLAVALLAVAAIGGALVTKVLQRPNAERVQEQTQTAPAQTAEAPMPQPSPPAAAEATREAAPATRPATRDTRPRPAQAIAAEPAREEADEREDEDRRGSASEKRRGREDREREDRGREDEVEKQMRKASKRLKGKVPRLVDVLTPAP